MSDTTDSAAALKAKRRGTATTRAATKTADDDTPSPLPEKHETLTEALTRRMPTLFDRREPPIVFETGGFLPSAVLEPDYVVAEFNASDSYVPQGCRTPISRTLWVAGQHVRRDVYATVKELRGIE